VLAILGRVNRAGATIVMVTHSQQVAEHASRVIRFEDGVVVADEAVERSLALEAAG
jgi:putative ABC transport system ATP-binding protein